MAKSGKNPVGSVSLGKAPPTIVPVHVAIIHGFGPPAHPVQQAAVHGSRGYGHVAKHHTERPSGHPGAHRIGGKPR